MRNVFSITEIFIMVHGHGHGKGKKQSWEGVEMQIVMYNVHMTDHSPKAHHKTAPRGPKLGYKGGRAPQLSARGTHAASGAGVVFHMYT